ncbi:hypothetical protein C5S39_12730, partial [Candidatus Methanophagaceae archaeon]
MPNGNGKPSWYKNPIYIIAIIGLIGVVLAAIIGATWPFFLNPPQSDFGIFVNPVNGAVQQGGVITTEITINSLHGYDYPVSLSAVKSSGIVLSFAPISKKPPYISAVTIYVNSTVQASEYKIDITGRGATGKEHTCCYTLTVNPTAT